MKDDDFIALLIAILIAILAVEKFYEHPTYGRGWKAIMALLSVAFAF